MAAQVVEVCDALRGVAAATSRAPASEVALYSKAALKRHAGLLTRCAAFDARDMKPVRNSLDEPFADRDAALKVRNASLTLNASEHRHAVEQWLKNPSPALLWESAVHAKNGTHIYFDGKQLPVGSQDQVLLESARLLAACDLGDHCGPNDPLLLMRCGLDWVNECPTSRSAAMHQTIALWQYDPADAQRKVAQMRQPLVSAIRDRQIDVFLPPQ